MSSLDTICKKCADIFVGIKNLHQLPGCIFIFGVDIDAVAKRGIVTCRNPGAYDLCTDHAGYIIYSVVIKAGDCLVVADQSLERLGVA